MRVLPNVLWTLAALVLVPVGLGLLVWGAGERYVRLLQMREEQAVAPTAAVFGGSCCSSSWPCSVRGRRWPRW